MLQNPKQRRAHQRYRRRCRVAVSGVSTFTSDVSASGFCAEVMRVVEPGTELRGTISVQGQDFAFAGRVRWARAGDARINMRGRMGIMFTEISEAFVQSLVSEPGRMPATGS